MTLAAALVLAGLWLAPVGAAQAQVPEESPSGVYERDAVDVEAPAGTSIARVRVDNRLGDVSVRGHDGSGIAIQSFKRAADQATLERLVVSLIPGVHGGVEIRTSLKAGPESRPIAAGSIAVDLVILVPHSAAVDAQLWKGNLRVSGLDNGARLLVDHGRIEVRQVSGAVDSDLRWGEQEFADVFGDLAASGVDGALHLDTIEGDRLSASMVRGTISGQGLRVKQMVVRSVWGDVELVAEPVPGGQYQVTSRKGSVRFRFHGSTPVAMEVSAAQAMLGPELHAFQPEQETARERWRGRFGRNAQVRPAQLEIRAAAGQVLVKHF